jgi:uncharacterized membrane protein YbaN (DUF454 family)
MKKTLLNIAGVIALLLAILGLFLPLLPTTPFLLLASACFARGSTRLHRWLLQHRVFGAYLRNVEAGNGIPLRAKIVALALMWTSLGVSFVRFEHTVALPADAAHGRQDPLARGRARAFQP